MSRNHLIAIGGGLVCALFGLSVISGSAAANILFFSSQLPLFLVGLSLGLSSAAIACIVAAGTIAVGTNLPAATLFAALIGVPVLIVIRQSLMSRPGTKAGSVEWYPPGRLLGLLTGYGLAMLAVASLAILASDGGLESSVRDHLQARQGDVSVAGMALRLELLISFVIIYFPALVVTALLLMAIVNTVLAQTILVHFNRNRRPSPRYGELELPRWLTIGLAVVLAASLLPGQAGLSARNAAIIIGLPFFFVGLAVIHTVAQRFAARKMLLLAVYVILILFGWPVVVVAGLGIVEQWALIRLRLAAAGSGREIE